MTENMKTVCVGRFLVDVPAKAEISLSRERIAGFEIETLAEDETAFRERIRAREAEIAAIGPGKAGKGGMVEARDLRVPNMIGRSLIFGRTRGYLMEGERRVDLESVSVEVHAHLGKFSFSLSANYVNEASASLAEALLARLQLRDEHEIPAAPGFCVEHAIFVEPLPVQKAEHIAMSVGLPEHPDLAVIFYSAAGADPGPGLLARIADVDGAASADELLRVTKLRSGPRSIHDMPGEEVVERVREFNFTTGYALNWEAPGKFGNVVEPYLSLEMQTGISERAGGKPVDSSLHEDAVLALWDSISSTIRLRKSAPPPAMPAPEPEGPKLGAMARAGEVCPQSGWWECGAGGDGLRVHGGQVQFVRKGERMPQALLLPRQTVWQKFRGIQPSIEPDRPTVWQLVDKRSRPRVDADVALAAASLPAAVLDMGAVAGRGAAVGSYVRTGDPCPASGWWRCEESQALDGTRWFAAGSLLPAATFRVPQGVFGRASGPEAIQRRSTWQLVRHAEGPAASA